MTRRIFPFIALVPFVLFLLVWEYVADSNDKVAFLAGQPSVIAARLIADLRGNALFDDLAVTIGCAIAGLTGGTLIGFSVGVGVGTNRFLDQSLSPFLNLLTVIPLFAAGPLIILIAGQGVESKILLSALSVSFFAVGLTYQHVKLTPNCLIETIRVLGRSEEKVIRLVYLPYAALRLTTNLRLLFGVAVTGVVIGEFLGAKNGIGRYIIVAEGLFDVDRIWAGILLLSGTAMLVGLLFAQVENFARRHLGKEN